MPNFVNPDRKEPLDPRFDLSRLTIHGHERDIADRLPGTTREKLTRLRRELADLHALARQPYDEARDLRERALECDARIAYLRGERPSGAAADETAKIIDLEIRAAERYRAEARELMKIYESRKEKVTALQAVIRRLELYLASIPADITLEMAPSVDFKLKGDPATAVEKLRKEIAALGDAAFDVEVAPIPSAVAKAKARQKIETLAARGAPDVLKSLESRSAAFSFPTKTGESVHWRDAQGAPQYSQLNDSFDAEGAFCWLHRDALVSAIEREIDNVSDDANALTDEQRAERLAEIAAQLLQVERQEESLIVAAAEAGVVILRRPDCDVRSVLGIEGPAPAAD